MATTFDIRDAPAQKILAIRESCKMGEIGETIGKILPEVMTWASQHGVTIAGPAFARYSDWKDGGCTVEAGFVVDSDVPAGDARVHGGEIGGGSAAFAMHVGPYDQIAETYAAMDQWIKSHGYTPASTMWEEYLDPPSIPQAKARTELWWPVQKS